MLVEDSVEICRGQVCEGSSWATCYTVEGIQGIDDENSYKIHIVLKLSFMFPSTPTVSQVGKATMALGRSLAPHIHKQSTRAITHLTGQKEEEAKSNVSGLSWILFAFFLCCIAVISLFIWVSPKKNFSSKIESDESDTHIRMILAESSPK